MRVTIDCREYDSLQPLSPHTHGASEPLVVRLANTLASFGHRVDAIYKGDKELWGDGVTWWPHDRHPRKCEVLISCEWLLHLKEFEYERLLVPLNKINPMLNGMEDKVEAFVCLSNEHVRELRIYTPIIKPEQCVVIPPGVEMPPLWLPKVRNRLIYCNTPERGLVHLARQWPRILERVPDATIQITYGLERSIETNKWLMDNMAQELLEVWDWVQAYPQSVLNTGRLSKEGLQRAQLEAEVYPYPCDAPLPGIFHALAGMEAAAAGCALLLSELEGLPEVFKDCADFLPIPVKEEQWSEAIAELLLDEERKRRMGQRARTWAKTKPWSEWAEAWQKLIMGGERAEPFASAPGREHIGAAV